MLKQIYTCLWFDGQAKVAADFYCSIFNNSKIKEENPMVVTVDLNGKVLMGLNGGPIFKMNPSISMVVECVSAKEANTIWDKLMDGGKVMMALQKYPWSELYGWLEDKFGFTWQITLSRSENPTFKITPGLLFTGDKFGKAADAINFYTSVFEHSSKGMTVPYPDEEKKTMYAEFSLNGNDFIAMDGQGAHEFTFNEGVSFVVNCDTQKEIDFYWNALTEGGEESQCGWLKDKFGISWQIVPAVLGKLMSDSQRAPRVVQAFMKMKKFDIETLENA